SLNQRTSHFFYRSEAKVSCPILPSKMPQIECLRLAGIFAHLSGSGEQSLHCPSLHGYHMLVVGGHVVSQTVEFGFIAASDMEGNAFLPMVDLYGSVVEVYPHLTAHVGIRNGVVVAVIRQLDSIVLLYGHLFPFPDPERLRWKRLENRLFQPRKDVPAAFRAILVRFVIEFVQVDADMPVQFLEAMEDLFTHRRVNMGIDDVNSILNHPLISRLPGARSAKGGLVVIRQLVTQLRKDRLVLIGSLYSSSEIVNQVGSGHPSGVADHLVGTMGKVRCLLRPDGGTEDQAAKG